MSEEPQSTPAQDDPSEDAAEDLAPADESQDAVAGGFKPSKGDDPDLLPAV